MLKVVAEPNGNPLALESERLFLLRSAGRVVRAEVQFPDYVFTRRDGSLRFTDVFDRGWIVPVGGDPHPRARWERPDGREASGMQAVRPPHPFRHCGGV